MRIIRLAENNQDVFVSTIGKKYFQEILTSTGLEKYAYNGSKVLFAKDKFKIVDGKEELAEDAGDFWNDIVDHINDLHNEGGISFKNGKKPEFLLKRIINLSTEENDFVLDCFAVSGSTCCVANKMKRKWIGIEIGSQAETHFLKRIKKCYKR